jgi:hypothetical protein
MAREHRESIKKYAEDAFKNHTMKVVGTVQVKKPALHDPAETMIEVAPYVWKLHCADPAAWSYWYFVAELPGAIVQYGDVGGLFIEAGKGYDLAWLDGAMGSLDYVLSKSKHKRDFFVEEKFKEYMREHGLDPGDYEGYADYALETGDSEAYESCHDWPSEALWAYWALHKFVELRRAQR